MASSPSTPGRDDTSIDWTFLDRSVRAFDREALLALTAAAVDSPSGGHRLPSLSLLWVAGLRAASGAEPADTNALRRLLARARRAAPGLRIFEDCWLADPRSVVRWSLGGQRLRFHPGAFTDPLQMLRVATVAAEAIDEAVLAEHGFSLSDLIEVALRYGAWRLGPVVSLWPEESLPRDTPEIAAEDLGARVARIAATPVILGDAEIDAVRAIQQIGPTPWITACADPRRAEVAWAWATVDVDQLDVTLGRGAAMLGHALALRSVDGKFPVPASMVLSGLAAGTARLAAEAANDEAAVHRLQVGVTEQALRLLNLPAPPSRRHVEVPDQTGPAPEFAGLVSIPSERRALAVKIVTALDLQTLEDVLADADDDLLALDVKGVRRLGVPIDPTGLVLPLVVYGGPYHEPIRERGPIAHLHVEDLVAMVQELDENKLDRDVLLQFLEELVTLPGIDHFLSFSAADTWRHWRNFGVLNPTGEMGVALAVDPRPDNSAWSMAAAWEPAETVLSTMGLPPTWLWASARLDELGHATLFSSDKEALFVLTEPQLVVRTTLDNPLPSLGIDASFGYGVADGIFLTLLNRPETARLLSESCPRPILVNVDFTADRQPGVNDQRIAIGWRTSDAPLPIIDLLIGPDWFELLAENPADAHRALGHVLLVSLDDLAPPNCDARRDNLRSTFLEAWCSAPPVAMIHFHETTRDYRPDRAFVLPRTFASRARAERLVARAVARAGVDACVLAGDDALHFLRDRLLPLIDEPLTSLLAPWSPDALLEVAEQVNDAYGERARAVAEIEPALAAPWAATWQTISRSAPEESEMTRPLDLLLERLLITPSSGPIVPDRFDIADAADLVAYALETALALDSATRRLQRLGVIVADDGRVTLVPGPAVELLLEDRQSASRDEHDLDVPAYLRADRDDRLRIRDDQRPEDPITSVRIDGHSTHQPTEFRPLARISGIPPRLLTADALLRTRCGTGINGLNAILGTAVTWDRDDDHVALVPVEDLRREAAAWSKLSLDEIDTAIERLTLDSVQLATEGLSYAAQERRHHRLAIRPLPLVDGHVLLMPWRIFAAQATYAGYLDDGRLPWHPADLPDDVTNAFIRYRQIANHALEHAALDVAHGLSLPGKVNITPAVGATAGLEIPGEIDLLVADPQSGRIWVVEVKDLYAAVSPQTMKRRIDKFTDPGRDGFINVLGAKRDAVANNPDAALKLLNTPVGTQAWRVLPLMATRRVEPAAFVAGIGVPFVVVDDLAALLSDTEDPVAGHAPIGQR